MGAADSQEETEEEMGSVIYPW